jgi:hypothetical protein
MLAVFIGGFVEDFLEGCFHIAFGLYGDCVHGEVPVVLSAEQAVEIALTIQFTIYIAQIDDILAGQIMENMEGS